MKFAWVLGLGVLACGPVKGVPGDALTPIDECAPLEFVRCNGAVAETCNATGDGVTQEECGVPGCNEGAARCNQCTPDTATCGTGGASVENCGADGLPAAPEACALNCTDQPTAHCAYLQPNYAVLADVCDQPATDALLEITASQTFDTASDAVVCNGGVITQPGGPAICVIRFGEIKVAILRTLSITGPRAVALVADTAIRIDGTIDASADGNENGPGGGTATSGSRPSTALGGGGAGFRSSGGAGGSDTANGGADNGGPASTNPANLVAFVGGPRPQLPNNVLDPRPGGGGAAITLIACRGSVTISATGTIDANGGGGQAGRDQLAGGTTSFFSGAGGGAGGNIVLQGLSLNVTGRLFANGGGGGGGTSVDDGAGQDGENGRRDTTQAAGGGGTGTGGSGGAGGTEFTVGGGGLKSAAVAGTPGGGGGAAGFVQAYTPAGVTPVLTPEVASPTFSPTRTTPTR